MAASVIKRIPEVISLPQTSIGTNGRCLVMGNLVIIYIELKSTIDIEPGAQILTNLPSLQEYYPSVIIHDTRFYYTKENGIAKIRNYDTIVADTFYEGILIGYKFD